ncbi:hypothetical protein SUGI_0549860 [Cryptomeria japonica]|nr:hypothetical protein SUGI_0549860 [Cryptomeria japonica]
MNAAVFLAARNGDLDAIKKLHGQNPRQLKEVSFEGNTVLHIAAKDGHLELVQWILQNVKGLITARNADYNTPLHSAAKGGNAEIITTLLRYNKCPAAKRNQFGESALLIAAEHGHVDAVRVLVDATPFYLIIWPRNDHQTCLHVAAYGGHFEVARLIIERKSFSNIVHFILLIRDVYGATPLHCAIHGEDPRIVTEILNVHVFCFDKSIMTKRDNFGRCAVHVAAIKGRWDMIEIFISRMPDCVEIRSSDLKTTLHFAVESNQFEVVQKLLFHYKLEEVAKLVSYDRDISGNTALHLATINLVDPQLVEYLVSFPNVNVNAINGDGKTVLDIVTSENKPRCDKIKCILEDAGASQSCINNSEPQKSTGSEQGNGDEGKIMGVDTLVASLIASITFSVIFQVPGGVTSGFKNKGENEVASLGLNTLFQIFLFSDSLALFSSLTVYH